MPQEAFLAPFLGALVVPRVPAEDTLTLSLVIPTFNEAKNIGALLEILDGLLRPVLGSSFELIVVDDNSPDETWRIAAELAARIPSIRVMRRREERGLSTAIIRGWQAARGEVLGVIDADLQHPPEVILPLLAEAGRGADLAAGSRNVVGGGVSDWSFARRVLSRGAQLLGLLILPEVLGRLSDPMSGVFLVRRSAVADVTLDPLGYKILIEVVGRCRIRWIAEVPYVFRERVAGESKVSFRVYREYLQHLIKLRFGGTSRSPFLRYLAVGTVAMCLDMGLLYVLSEPSMHGWGIARSKLIGGLVALLLSFPAHEFWSFRNITRPPGRAALRRLLAFVAVSAVGLFGATLALSVLVEFAGLNRYFANAVGIISVGAWNYLLHRQITWTRTLTRIAPAQGAPPPPPSLSAATIEKIVRARENTPEE